MKTAADHAASQGTLPKSSASASLRASASRPLSIKQSAAPARQPAKLFGSLASLNRLLDELAGAALLQADREQLRAEEERGVGLTRCARRLERPHRPLLG